MVDFVILMLLNVMFERANDSSVVVWYAGYVSVGQDLHRTCIQHVLVSVCALD